MLVVTAGRGQLLLFIMFLIGAVRSCLIGTLSLQLLGFFPDVTISQEGLCRTRCNSVPVETVC